MKSNGNFLKMPKLLLSNTPLKLNIGDIENEMAITISFWFKYYGFVQGTTGSCLTIIRINKERNANVCLDKLTFSAVVSVSENDIPTQIFKDDSIGKMQGNWNLISIANFYSKGDISTYFENMTNLFIFDVDAARPKSSFIPSPGFPINTIELGYEVVSKFADLRIYKTYIVHPLGLIMNTLTKNNFLYKQFKFNGTNSGNCISLEETAESSISIECTEDYNMYLDTSNECKEMNKYLDNSDITSLKCSSNF